MITPVANAYANALISSSASNDELVVFIEKLKKISHMFEFEKIHHIIETSNDSVKIVDFLLDSPDKKSKLHNFLRILTAKKRLNILPQIYQALILNKAIKEDTYEGIVFSKDTITQSEIEALQVNISEKINKNIRLTYRKNEYSGVRVSIDMLNIEISFSKDQIKKKLVNHILQSI